MIVKTKTPLDANTLSQKTIVSKVHIPHTKLERNLFREENSRLKIDISRLKIEKNKLREENSILKTENSQLKTENLQLSEEVHQTNLELQEAQEYSELMDMELARNNALYHLLEEEHLRSHLD
ncbi:hypothetical protein QUF50_05795 [Thiotrichales bacterium HSG1]|nr:hypothetical protein [Thiotrichales bacterium HSG1]